MAQRHLARTIALQTLAEWDFNKSILNACPIHNFGGCHIGNSELHKIENEKKLLREVLELLVKNDCEFKEIDKEFYQVYKKLYEI